ATSAGSRRSAVAGPVSAGDGETGVGPEDAGEGDAGDACEGDAWTCRSLSVRVLQPGARASTARADPVTDHLRTERRYIPVSLSQAFRVRREIRISGRHHAPASAAPNSTTHGGRESDRLTES